MRLRSLLAGAAVLAAASAGTITVQAGHADTGDSGDPLISPALVTEVAAKRKVRSIVELRQGQSVTAVAGDLAGASRVVESARSPHFFVAELDRPALDKLKKDNRVRSVYKDELSKAFLDRSTRVIRSDRANRLGYNGGGTTVAVLDTGIDETHPFLAGRIVAEACFSSTDTARSTVSLCPNGRSTQTGPGAASAQTPLCVVDGVNKCAHGTHVAGIAAGRFTPGAPADGVAPSANVIAVQVFSRMNDPAGCDGGGPCYLSFTSDQKLALEYVAKVAKEYDVAAVNMSFGGGGPYKEACDADATAGALKPDFDALIALGAAPVVAAGNSSFQDGVAAPACISTAVTVGATDDDDRLADFTDRGPLLDLFAPGVAIRSSVAGGGYGELSGTSMAAPHVAGAFAVMKQVNPDFTVEQNLAALRRTGKEISYEAGSATVRTPRIDVLGATRTPRV